MSKVRTLDSNQYRNKNEKSKVQGIIDTNGDEVKKEKGEMEPQCPWSFNMTIMRNKFDPNAMQPMLISRKCLSKGCKMWNKDKEDCQFNVVAGEFTRIANILTKIYTKP